MWNWVGLAAAGILNGSFAVPMKTAKRWSFEHIWAMFSLLAMAVLPWLAVSVAIPQWRSLLGGVPGGGLARLVALGLLWGLASLLYGMAWMPWAWPWGSPSSSACPSWRAPSSPEFGWMPPLRGRPSPSMQV